MTPEELDAIERDECRGYLPQITTVPRLCAALRAAWAERAEAHQLRHDEQGNAVRLMMERDARPSPEVVAKVKTVIGKLHDFCAVYSVGGNDLLVEAREAMRLLAAEVTLINREKNAFADERDAAIKERDEARRCQALTMDALNAVNRELTTMQTQRYRDELAKRRQAPWAADSTTLRDAITDAPNPEK